MEGDKYIRTKYCENPIAVVIPFLVDRQVFKLSPLLTSSVVFSHHFSLIFKNYFFLQENEYKQSKESRNITNWTICWVLAIRQAALRLCRKEPCISSDGFRRLLQLQQPTVNYSDFTVHHIYIFSFPNCCLVMKTYIPPQLPDLHRLLVAGKWSALKSKQL